MKYLNITHIKDAYWMLTPEKQAEIRLAELSFHDKCVKSGKLLETYYLPDMKGSVTIWDLASSEECARIAIESPANPYGDNEFMPLIERDVALKVMKEMLVKAKKVAKK